MIFDLHVGAFNGGGGGISFNMSPSIMLITFVRTGRDANRDIHIKRYYISRYHKDIINHANNKKYIQILKVFELRNVSFCIVLA